MTPFEVIAEYRKKFVRWEKEKAKKIEEQSQNVARMEEELVLMVNKRKEIDQVLKTMDSQAFSQIPAE